MLDEPKTYAMSENLPKDKSRIFEEISNISANNDVLTIRRNGSKDITVVMFNDTQEAKTILIALSESLNSIWFSNLQDSTKENFYRAITKFIAWINIIENVGFKVVKEFEEYEVNEKKLLPQGSRASLVKQMVDFGKQSEQLDIESRRFLAEVVNHTKLAKHEDSPSYNLGHWFTRHGWIREAMGDNYLKLASPKRLIRSFTVTIATTLLYLIEARNELRKDKLLNIAIKNYRVNPDELTRNTNIARLLKDTVTFDSEITPNTPISNILWNDCIIPKHIKKIIDRLQKDNNLGFITVLRGKPKSTPYLLPKYFLGDLSTPTVLEETLAHWLCASLAVQPSDTQLLSKGNIIMERNTAGRVVFCEINYYKGRADRIYGSPLLKRNSIVLKALVGYIESLPVEQEALFNNKIMKRRMFTNPFSKERINASICDTSLLFKLWASKDLGLRLRESYAKNNCSSIFLDGLLCLLDERAIDHQCWTRKYPDDPTYKQYLKTNKLTLPQSVFSLTHIKNTAVYATTDQYRLEDLTSDSSHTPSTERLSYLSDSNLDWVNLVGRITRMVLYDMQFSVYKPNITLVDTEVYNKVLHTKIIRNDLPSDTVISAIGCVDTSKISSEEYDNQYLVFDSSNSALAMIHYIEQADINKESLFDRNPDFFINTVLVNVEWMHFCLSKLSPENVSKAQQQYYKIKKHLPKMFINEMQTGISL